MTGTGSTWTLTTAATRFDDVVDRAIADGPQTIDGEDGALAVVVSVEQWARLTTGQATSPETGAPRNADPTGPLPG